MSLRAFFTDVFVHIAFPVSNAQHKCVCPSRGLRFSFLSVMFIIGWGRPFVASFSNMRQLPDDQSHARYRGVFRLRCRVRVRTDEQMGNLRRTNLFFLDQRSLPRAICKRQDARLLQPNTAGSTLHCQKKKESILENEKEKEKWKATPRSPVQL